MRVTCRARAYSFAGAWKRPQPGLLGARDCAANVRRPTHYNPAVRGEEAPETSAHFPSAPLQLRRVLVLNATYEPLSVVSMPRAVNLLLGNKAEMTEESDVILHSASLTMAAPLVVRLLHYVRVPRNLPMPLSRRAILLRDNYQCQYCGAQPGKELLTIDHILPRSRGGRTDWENVTTACGACNRRKGNRLPDEAGMPVLHEPTRPRFWSMALLTVPGNEVWRKYLANASRG